MNDDREDYVRSNELGPHKVSPGQRKNSYSELVYTD